MSNNNLDSHITTLTDLDSLSTDEKFMLRCIQIAKNGLGLTAPNPMVGAVVVYKGNIIGEGFTSPYGGAHAEVNAINSVTDVSLLKSATLYVTLEPCSHYGKTPPCADLIVKMGIPKVVIGLKDPHEKVAGQGIKKLKQAGCIVELGILKELCEEHHKRFLTFYIKKRPYIILKWAETSDGFIAPEITLRSTTKKPYWITTPKSRQLVHKWRSEEQAILVGTNTVIADNPSLNLRDWNGRPPTRIIIDRSLKIPVDFHVLDGKQHTIVCTEVSDANTYKEGISYKTLDFTTSIPKQLCDLLYKEQVQSVIIEGGSQTLTGFIDNNLWDEARIFKGTTRFCKGLKAPKISGTTQEVKQIATDQLFLIKND